MQRTRTGVELLLESNSLRGRRVGLVTNPTGILPDGTPTWQAMLEAGHDLRALFGPEHGFRGEAQAGEAVADASFRGVRVHSLYGDRRTPLPEMLVGLDAVVYDIQDVGCRWYTYIYTLATVMDACTRSGKRLVVLDRPNPIDASRVEGSPVGAGFESFVGGYGLAPRYGMTVGEFAAYLRLHYYPGAELEIVWMDSYRRDSYYEETGLPWPLPSPNLPHVDAALLYAGTCLVEGTNLSEGRGTTRPFELVGAPWVDADRFRDRLAGHRIPGVVFSRLSFTPTFSKHAGERCEGVLIHVLDRRVVSPLRVGLTLIAEAAMLFAGDFAWREPEAERRRCPIDLLAGGPPLRDWVRRGTPVDELYERFSADQADFESRRLPALHYE